MSTPMSKEETNFYRLAVLLFRIAPRAVKLVFDYEFPPLMLQQDLHRNRRKIDKLLNGSLISQPQYDLLYPKGSSRLSSEAFDMPLMVCLLRHFSDLNIQDTLPSEQLHNAGADISRIKYYRNYISHSYNGKVTENTFTEIWNCAVEAIQRLVPDLKPEIDALVSSPILDIRDIEEKLDKKFQYRTAIEMRMQTLEKENFADDKVPIEIRQMSNKKYVPLYLKLLESGSEKKRDIRLVIVGKKGTGKTSLLKRLFREDINNSELTSTNGIEIHRIRCKANYDDGIWYKLDGINEETELHARLLKPYDETLTGQGKQPIEVLAEATGTQAKPYTPDTIPYIRESTELEAKTFIATENQPANLSIEQAFTDIETMLKSKVDLDDREEYATLLLWDFAGDDEFYHTHQTFLSPDAIYLVVTKLNEVQDKEAQALFRLWMDSIHCYSRLENENNKSDDMRDISEDLDPPVVIVGTWKDAVTSKSAQIKEACRRNLLMITEAMAEDERGHIRDAVLISNTEDNDSVFQQMRVDILTLARTRKTWNQNYPLKFIQLEKRLQEKKKVFPIITFGELKQISAKTPNPLNGEELIMYLKYHHEIRALVYFEDLPDYIILDTQWLSDAFKCIVTAKKFQTTCISIKNQKRWEEFHSMGKLHEEVLEDIFKGGQMLNEHKEHILNVMEKFDIIIRPIKSEEYSTDEKRCYHVPCMIKSVPECDIYKMFNVTENTCKKSTWLCFMFRFLPPHLMNHLIASLCREYKVAEVNVIEQEGEKSTTQRVIALFRGIAVFELKKTTKLSKLLIATCENCILLQIFEFGKRVIIESGMYKHIADFVTDEINKIIGTRFKMTNVKFQKKWDCGRTKLESVTGSNDFFAEDILEYYCEKCTITHEFANEWSDRQSNTLCVSKTFEDF
ncbi:Hypothetical predicted protein [Mytilus galloprovincialis]|uniref:non-specific serine/threonine protein kinase n=1 Tax=Mytilus galloprovincialis TaxID=29158 RepID=A0A8B6GPB4_MYTGA|nr:Hypothetical predicted protein [Mytilus galloprovincialis]